MWAWLWVVRTLSRTTVFRTGYWYLWKGTRYAVLNKPIVSKEFRSVRGYHFWCRDCLRLFEIAIWQAKILVVLHFFLKRFDNIRSKKFKWPVCCEKLHVLIVAICCIIPGTACIVTFDGVDFTGRMGPLESLPKCAVQKMLIGESCNVQILWHHLRMSPKQQR